MNDSKEPEGDREVTRFCGVAQSTPGLLECPCGCTAYEITLTDSHRCGCMKPGCVTILVQLGSSQEQAAENWNNAVREYLTSELKSDSNPGLENMFKTRLIEDYDPTNASWWTSLAMLSTVGIIGSAAGGACWGAFIGMINLLLELLGAV